MDDIVKTFSDDIQMSFGIEKCNRSRQHQILLWKMERKLNNQEYYKYLGFSEREVTMRETKSKLKTEYFQRVKKVLKTQLNSKNTINAINAYATPSLTYGFQVNYRTGRN